VVFFDFSGKSILIFVLPVLTNDSVGIISETRDMNACSTFVVFFADVSTYVILNESAKFYKKETHNIANLIILMSYIISLVRD